MSQLKASLLKRMGYALFLLLLLAGWSRSQTAPPPTSISPSQIRTATPAAVPPSADVRLILVVGDAYVPVSLGPGLTLRMEAGQLSIAADTAPDLTALTKRIAALEAHTAELASRELLTIGLTRSVDGSYPIPAAPAGSVILGDPDVYHNGVFMTPALDYTINSARAVTPRTSWRSDATVTARLVVMRRP